MKSNKNCYGIDLGTSYSVVYRCVLYQNKYVYDAIKDNETEASHFPSVLSYKSGQEFFGKKAVDNIILDPPNFIKNPKRYLYNSKNSDINDNFNNDEGVYIINNEKISPEIALKRILSHLKELINEENPSVIITVPIKFLKKKAIKRISQELCFNLLGLFPEPVCAAVAYSLLRSYFGTFIICDFGGGTFDVALCQISEQKWEILNSHGDHNLGGIDIDKVFFDYVLKKFTEKNIKIDTIKKQGNLKRKCIEAKIVLSYFFEVEISMGDSKSKTIVINRNEFNDLIHIFIEKCIKIIIQTFEEINFNYKNLPVNYVLTGGSSRIPLFRDKIKEYFNVEPEVAFDPDDAIAIGASIYSCYLSNNTNTETNKKKKKKK